MAQKSLEWAARLAQVPKGTLLLLQHDTGVYQLAASLAVTAEEQRDYRQEPLVGAPADRGPSETPAWGRHPLLGRLFSPKSTLAVPLGDAGSRIGLLLLDVSGSVAARRRAAGLLAGELSLVLRNAQLVRELSERNRQLATATASLLQTEKLALTGKMAATVAHHMRNPLSVIGANVQLLMSRRPSDDPDLGVMQVLLEKVRETNATVHSLLELARPLVLVMKRVNLDESVRIVARFVGPRCEAQAVELRLAAMPGLPDVWADEQLLQRCLLDLCLNAIQAMPGGGRLVVAAVAFGQRVELRIEDSGPGISADMRRELFEPFSTDKAKGSGLGLYNVKRGCDAMGVEVTVADADPHGASFRLSFPVGRSVPQPILETVQFERAPRPDFTVVPGERP